MVSAPFHVASAGETIATLYGKDPEGIWNFQPRELLEIERERIESVLQWDEKTDLLEVLRLLPGKQLADLGQKIQTALTPFLPPPG